MSVFNRVYPTKALMEDTLSPLEFLELSESEKENIKSTLIVPPTAYPGVVATQIRYRGYNAAGQAAGASGLKEDDAMSVEECARLIREGMERRQREVVMKAKGKIGRFLKLLAPGIVENMALAALKDEVKPK